MIGRCQQEHRRYCSNVRCFRDKKRGARQQDVMHDDPPAAHILSFAQGLGGGGVERALLRLAGEWSRADRRVTIVVGSDEGPLSSEWPARVSPVVTASSRYGSLLRALPGIVSRERPDVLFCPGNHYTGIAAWTRLRLGRACPPIIAKMSNAPSRGDHGPIIAAAHRLWLAGHSLFLDHLVAMTDATGVEAATATRMAGRTSVIANPPARPLPDAVDPPLPDGRFILGVGRLVAQKRWDRLIAALPRLADDSVQLVLLGDGPLRLTLLAQAAALGVGHRVHLPGHAADPLPSMARASLVALPSEFEGVPGVLREALSVGTPVVATDASSAIAEIVSSAALGSIVARNDRDALVAALNRWLAPDAVRPVAVPPPGIDSAQRYLARFDQIVSSGPPRFRPRAPKTAPARP